MHLRLPVAVTAAFAALALIAPSAFGASNTVVISQVAFRGPGGASDEVIELRNISATAQDISGWEIWGSNATGAVSNRATIASNTTLPAGSAYVLADTIATWPTTLNLTPDAKFSVGITDTGGVQLRNAAGLVIDAVGSASMNPGLPYREGGGLNFPTANGNDAFIRKNGGAQDTDFNENDFTGPQAIAPQPCGAACAAPDPCAADPDTGVTRINQIQTLGDNSACNLHPVTIRGIVTGVDNLYGSNFSSIFKGDAGIWVQERVHDPNARTSEGIFVPGIKRDPVNPASIIGANVTVHGTVVTQFGLVEVAPPGVVVSSSREDNEVDFSDPRVGTINSLGNSLPAPVTIDPVQARAQGADRQYYRSLQGMRVKLDEGIANGGGTTKFREVFLTPGHTPQRLFNTDVTGTRDPWLDQPEEIGAAADAGAYDPANGKPNPPDPRLDWRSRTEIDLDLFDVVHNVVGPLTYSFSFYEVMNQEPVGSLNAGEQPAITRGPINAAYPPTVPAQPPNTFRLASFNVENYFPVGEENDGHVITQADYNAKTGAIVKAIHNFLGDPDVVAVQEVAVFANGHNALTGLAQALGNYTPYIAVNNDARGIAPGFLVKDGVTASNPRILGKDETYNAHSEGSCDLAGGRLFDRAPFALDVRKGDLDITALSNHWGSQSHAEPCRVAEAEYVRQQAVALQAAGRNVLVAGDLNDFVASDTTGIKYSDAIARLIQGGTLTDLWSKAPEDNRYSYKFDGHLQTLDHIAVTAGLVSRVTDMRYVHFDNDYYERSPADGTGISDHDPPMVTLNLAGTSTPGTVSGTVPATLSLTLSGPITLGQFVVGKAADYTGTTTATVNSSAGDAQLSVLDASSDHPGHLVNGAYALAEPLQAAAGTAAFAPLRADNGPLALRSWSGPVANDQTTLAFKQTIGANEGLRTGTYGKTLTFTLSTTQP